MSYDPEALGANCEGCILRAMRTGGPVGPELHDGADVAVVAEAPGEKEVEIGRPLVGQSGLEFGTALSAVGVTRSSLRLLNALCCRPPDNELDRVVAKWQRGNRKRAAAGEPVLPHPVDCCRPRLVRELEGISSILTLGKTGFSAVTGENKPIIAIRGGPIEGWLDAQGRFGRGAADVAGRRAVRLLPTLHPSFVLRQRRWTRAFRADLGRAFRWLRGMPLNWADPHVVYDPSPDELERFLARTDVDWSVDVETSLDDPTESVLRTVGISNEHSGVVMTLDSIERPGTSHYRAADDAAVRAVLTRFFSDPDRMKIGHNCLFSGTPVILGDGTACPIDRLVRERYAGEVIALADDGTMVRTRVVDWFRKRVPDQDWVVVRRFGEKGGARGLTLTPDHEVFTPRGKVQARDLVPGVDSILSGEREFDADETSAILGSLLGDSTAVHYSSGRSSNPATAETAVFRGSHTPGALAQEKARWIPGLKLGTEVATSGYNPGRVVTTYRTPQMRQIADLARLVYDDVGRRRLRPSTLDRIGPVGLAWLFADDGCKHSRPDRQRENVLIATCGFPREDIEAGRAWFSLNFGRTTITRQGSLRLGVDASQKFAHVVAPYLLPAARYKLPRGEWPAFVGFPGRRHRPHAVRVESVEPFHPATKSAADRMHAETRWCLQTTAGNFLTGFGFVKNCGYFDNMVIRRHFGVSMAPLLDTILLHRAVEGELPHNLGYVGSIYTDVPSWKEAHTATTATSDRELAFYNCLRAGTPVLLADGSTRPIERLVQDRFGGDVLSRDVSGRMVSRRVIGWHRFRTANQRWVRVSIDNGSSMVVTPDHGVSTPNGMVEAARLRSGDSVHIPEPALEGEVLSAVVGTLLGDSRLAVSPVFRSNLGKARAASLTGGHVEKSGLSRDKVNSIPWLFTLRDVQTVGSGYLPGGSFQRFTAPTSRGLGRLLSLWADPDGKRRIRVEMLDLLGPAGFAWWFMDDGCRAGTQVRLALHRYPEADRAVALKRIEAVFGPSVLYTGSNTGTLALGRAASSRFCEAIAPFVFPAQRHRLPPGNWPEYRGIACGEPETAVGLVEAVESFEPLRGSTTRDLRADTSWCITVEETHNFFTTAANVSNCVDCCVVARAMPQLARAAKVRGQGEVVLKDHKVQAFCVGLHENGMFVDLAERNRLASEMVAKIDLCRREVQSASGVPDINPNSVPQLRTLLFDDWRLPPADWTKLGDPSTSDECLRIMRTAAKDDARAPQIISTLDALRRFRKVAKEYGTYVKKLVPRTVRIENDGVGIDEEAVDEEGNPIEEQERRDDGLVFPDGRMRPDYNCHTPVTGRISSSHMNAQNVPVHLRRMIVAEPGRVIVGADADQLELRVITAVARIGVYLEAFAQGRDPHAMTASLMFGRRFTDLVPKSKLWDELRKLGKTIKYASFYGSGDETVHGIVTSAENSDGSLMYPDLSVREVATMKRNWLRGIPELPRWWDDSLERFRSQGFLADPVWHRRRDFLDGEKFNEIVNFAIQAAGAAIVHDSTFDLLDGMPFGKWGKGTGLVNQMHDALYAEVPCDHDQAQVPKLPNGKWDESKREFGWCPPGCCCEANRAARLIEECMNRTVPALEGVKFSASAHISHAWGG